jgi:hypothetical protein
MKDMRGVADDHPAFQFLAGTLGSTGGNTSSAGTEASMHAGSALVCSKAVIQNLIGAQR